MKVETASRLGNVEEYYFSKKLREIRNRKAEGEDIINLGIGSPDLLPPPAVIERMKNSVSEQGVHGYQSYSGIPELRKAMSNWYAKFFDVQLEAENEILPLIGSKEGIMHISMAFLNPGDQVLVPNPGYPSYAATAKLTGADILPYELKPELNWQPDLAMLNDIDLSKVKLMWLNYPHMPSGAKADASFYTRLIAFAKENEILLVNDNPYSFILNEELLSILNIPGAKEVAMELNSLSKSHHMSGWRVGMLAGRSDLIASVLRFKSNMDSGMFKGTQLAAIEALNTSDQWHKAQNEIYSSRKNVAKKVLENFGCTIEGEQSGMFVWAKIEGRWKDAFEASDELLNECGLFITPGGIFGSAGNQYLRISLCSPESVLRTALARVEKLKLTES